VALHRYERKQARRRRRIASGQRRSDWYRRMEVGAELFKQLASEVEKALPKEAR
jgi:hypothetical protein